MELSYGGWGNLPSPVIRKISEILMKTEDIFTAKGRLSLNQHWRNSTMDPYTATDLIGMK